LESLENLDGPADDQGAKSNKKGPGKERNLSGIVSATSKALKAALMENEELLARNAELEAKLVTGGADDTDAGQIEQALSDASAALATRREEIAVLEQQVATLQADNAVLHESQLRLQAAINANIAEDSAATPAQRISEQIQQLSSEIVELRAANHRLDSLYADLLLVSLNPKP
jgi:chromosome segregation ATPase